MARRRSTASRSSSSSGGSRAGGGKARGGAGPRARSDGRVDCSCPQCGVVYRVPADSLDQKIECSECHRVFFAKTTAGKRPNPPDYTKAYIGFGVAVVFIIAIFVMMSGGGKEPPKQKDSAATAPKPVVYTLGTHPRADQLVKWAQALAADSHMILGSHSDVASLATQLGVDADQASVMRALQEHESTMYLRTMACDSASLDSEADMTAATGSATIYVTPKPGDDTYKKNTRGEIAVTFRADGEQVRVTGFQVKMKPVWNPAKPQPGKTSFVPNADIAAPKAVEVSDSAGTRKVQESEPSALPHWKDATPELRELADQVVADIVKSADNEAPGGLFNRATMRIMSNEQKKAAVPRVLNAMFERYSDVNAHNIELSQLNRALYQWTGFAVNYQVESTDPTKDKAARESCIRQWFAFWWKHHDRLDEFFDSSENLDEPLLDEPAKKKKG